MTDAKAQIKYIEHNDHQIQCHVRGRDSLYAKLSETEIIDEARYRCGQRSDHAAGHGVERHGAPERRIGRLMSEDVADKRENPQRDRKDDQHGMDGVSVELRSS